MRKSTGRVKPVTPKAGVTKTSRRYACGGSIQGADTIHAGE